MPYYPYQKLWLNVPEAKWKEKEEEEQQQRKHPSHNLKQLTLSDYLS
jgi:hypothetical protein